MWFGCQLLSPVLQELNFICDGTSTLKSIAWIVAHLRRKVGVPASVERPAKLFKSVKRDLKSFFMLSP